MRSEKRKKLTVHYSEAFKDKTLVIMGGTGNSGSTVLKHFLTADIGGIKTFFRDEKRLDHLDDLDVVGYVFALNASTLRHKLRANSVIGWICS